MPSPPEINNCSSWLGAEFALLEPELVIPVGKLAIRQFIDFEKLDAVIGRKFTVRREQVAFDLIPLPTRPALRRGIKLRPDVS